MKTVLAVVVLASLAFAGAGTSFAGPGLTQSGSAKTFSGDTATENNNLGLPDTMPLQLAVLHSDTDLPLARARVTVPEPATVALLGVAMLGLAALRRRV